MVAYGKPLFSKRKDVFRWIFNTFNYIVRSDVFFFPNVETCFFFQKLLNSKKLNLKISLFIITFSDYTFQVVRKIKAKNKILFRTKRKPTESVNCSDLNEHNKAFQFVLKIRTNS